VAVAVVVAVAAVAAVVAVALDRVAVDRRRR
jgi:hypothetical protein